MGRTPAPKDAENHGVFSRELRAYAGPPQWTLAVLGAAAFVSLTAPILAPFHPDAQGSLTTSRLLPPLHSSFLYLFGTDDVGRDVFSRTLFGCRVSLGVGIAAALGAICIGTLVGLTSGMSRRFADAALMRIVDLFMAIPPLFLVIGLVAAFGPSIVTLVLVLSCTGWMQSARIVRGEVLSLREREFIQAARLLGLPDRKIMARHLLPNLAPVIVTSAILQFGSAVLAEAALGFLGLGVQPPTATWGNMMGESVASLQTAWWVGFFPGAFLAAVLVASHRASERGGRNPEAHVHDS
ncbi:MAG TPA: ABC transporter permease [Bacteroidota bacterium]